MSKPFTRKNRGTFNISSETLFNGDLSQLLEIYAALEFIPTKVEHLFANKMFDCIGLSPNFREVPDNEVHPVYNVIVTIKVDPETGKELVTAVFKEI